MLEIAALWKNTDKNGCVYLSGSLGGAKLLVLPNKNKKECSKEPDFRVLVCEKPKKEQKISCFGEPPVAHETPNPFPNRV